MPYLLAVGLTSIALSWFYFYGMNIFLGIHESNWPEQPDEKSGVALRISPESQFVKFGKMPKFNFTFMNHGENEVILVEPGDGSAGNEFSWRTPLCEWSRHTRDTGDRFCGNINALCRDEVFSIAPGKSFQSKGGWFGCPKLSGPGRYRVSLRYENQPTRKWVGLPLGEHDPEAMALVRRSTPVVIISNQVEIIVTP
jgi:hypothetical protein